MSDIDSDEDNIVRYGTQLEPYEEDCTWTMPNPSISSTDRKRLKRLIALNVSYKKAIQICHLPWPEICERMPGIESNVPQDSSSQHKKLKKKRARERKRLQRIESNSGVCKPYKETNFGPYLNCGAADAPQERIWIKRNLKAHSPKENRSHTKEQPHRAVEAKWSNHIQQNYCKPKFSPHETQSKIIPMEYTSMTNTVHGDRQLNYMDNTDSLHVKVQNGMRAVKRRHNDSETDVRPYLEDTHKVQKTSIKIGSEINYWEHTRPSKDGLRNAMYPIQHVLIDNEPDQMFTWGQPCKVQKTPVKGGSKVNYWAHTSQIGLQNDANLVQHINDERDEKFAWGQPHMVQKTSIKSGSEVNYWEPAHALKIEPQNEPHPIKHVLNYIESNDTHCWGQPHKVQKIPLTVNDSAKLIYGDPNHLLRAGLQNEMPPIKHNPSDNESNEIYSWDQVHKIQKTSLKSYKQLDYADTDRPSRIGLRNETHPVNRMYSRNELDKDCNGDQHYRAPNTHGSRIHPKFRGDGCSSLRNDSVFKEDPIMDAIEIAAIENESDKDSFGDRTIKPLENFAVGDAKLKKAKPIRVGIENITLMTKEQMILVHRAINQAIVQIGVQGAGPRFLGSTQKLGWILMICENYESQKWLEKEIPKLKPWPGAKLSVILRRELPKQILATIFIPSKEDVTVPTALELLRVQNPGLETGRWKVLKKTKVSTGNIVHLMLDMSSYEALKLMNYKANLGISKTTFKIKSTSKNLIRDLRVKPKNRLTEITSASTGKPIKCTVEVPCAKISPEINNVTSKSANLMPTKRLSNPHVSNKIPPNSPLQKFVRERMNSCSTQTSEMEESKPVVKNLVKSPPSKKWYPNVDKSSDSEWIPW